MKKVSLLFAMFLAFAVFAYAQSSDTQSGSSSSSPSASQGSSSSQGSSTTQPDASTNTPSSSSSSQGTSTSQGSSTGSSQGTMGSQGSSSSQGGYGSQGSTTGGMEAGKNKEAGHKYKGCLRSEGGKFALEDAHGRMYNLNSSEDLSAHVGHEVVVHGTESSAAGAPAASSTAGATKEISVTKVDHVSDTCKLGKHSKSEKGSSTKNPTSPQ
jgi:hypothetical protein